MSLGLSLLVSSCADDGPYTHGVYMLLDTSGTYTNELGQASRKPVELDQSSVGRLSRMDAMQNQAMAQATERRRLAELQRIEQAFKAMEQGEYGFCVECGEEIALKRLEIDPAAIACVKCAGG